jgi:FtsZ-interacting cell division protein ZipA
MTEGLLVFEGFWTKSMRFSMPSMSRNKNKRQKRMKRVDIKSILQDPAKRKQLFVDTLIAIQAREGIETSQEQAEQAYEKIQIEKSRKR